MNLSRQQQLLQGQSSLARKVFGVVPIQDAWAANYIMSELSKSEGSSASAHAIRSCLGDLEDAGLVKQTADKRFQRVVVKTPEVNSLKQLDKLVQPEPKKPTDSFESLVDLAAELVDLGKDVNSRLASISTRMEELALSIESERKENAQATIKLKQLQSLLKDIGGA